MGACRLEQARDKADVRAEAIIDWELGVLRALRFGFLHEKA